MIMKKLIMSLVLVSGFMASAKTLVAVGTEDVVSGEACRGLMAASLFQSEAGEISLQTKVWYQTLGSSTGMDKEVSFFSNLESGSLQVQGNEIVVVDGDKKTAIAHLDKSIFGTQWKLNSEVEINVVADRIEHQFGSCLVKPVIMIGE
jgi:hypothetical protein